MSHDVGRIGVGIGLLGPRLGVPKLLRRRVAVLFSTVTVLQVLFPSLYLVSGRSTGLEY